jgi:cytochrome c
MLKIVAVWIMTLVLVAVMAVAAAGRQPTVVHAKAAWWAKKGVAFFKANGKDKALAEFNQPQGKFVKDDVYIYVLDLNGKMVANPNSKLVGQDFMKVKDPTGKLFAAEIVKQAKEQGSGWVAYSWENPQTKKVEPLSVYFEKVDGLIICGASSGK